MPGSVPAAAGDGERRHASSRSGSARGHRSSRPGQQAERGNSTTRMESATPSLRHTSREPRSAQWREEIGQQHRLHRRPPARGSGPAGRHAETGQAAHEGRAEAGQAPPPIATAHRPPADPSRAVPSAGRAVASLRASRSPPRGSSRAGPSRPACERRPCLPRLRDCPQPAGAGPWRGCVRAPCS